MGSGGLVALGLLFFFDPAVGVLYPSCLFSSIFGRPCPGCGTLRAVHQLLHGNFSQAWLLNSSVTVIAPILGVWFVVHTWRSRHVD